MQNKRTEKRRKKSSGGKVRYAVVGLGHIAQVAALPAFEHASNSVLAGLVSGSPKKRQQLAANYQVENTWSYAEYDACLRSGLIDAVFIALPNDLHRAYAVRAAEAGIHVLCEKPLAVTGQDCAAMIRAARDNGVKLMTAYRLHFEASTLRVIEAVEAGQIGRPRFFHSSFSFEITDPNNTRLKRVRGGGTLPDIGVYCLNAARHVFRAEPEEVFAMSASSDDVRFREVDEITAGLLRFPDGRLATFVTSFCASGTDYFEVIGTEGSIRLEPAFDYKKERLLTLRSGQKEQRKAFPRRDHFGAQFYYFSECILNGTDPEPSGEEGLIDVQIVEALYKSAKLGRAVKLAPFPQKPRPAPNMVLNRPPVEKVKVIGASPPN